MDLENIGAVASYVRNLKLEQVQEKIGISVIKKELEIEEEQMQALAQMLKIIAPTGGTNINIYA